MRSGWHILAVLSLAVAAFCADQSTPPPSKTELKDAKSAYARGLKLQKAKHYDEALEEFESAVKLNPQNTQYLTAREMLRQQLVFEHVEHGNTNLNGGHTVEALADFRSALNLDPQNDYVQQRVHDVSGTDEKTARLARVLEDSGELHLKPNALRSDFHFRGDSRELITQIASVYGVTAAFDDSAVSRPVRFDITDVDFETAMQAACDITKLFWTPLSEKQILVAADTLDNHHAFDRMLLRTFYIPGLSDPKDLTDITNLLRNLFDIRSVQSQPQSGTVVVRAPQKTLDAATTFLESLDYSKPQVMLDIRVYEVSHTFIRNIGLNLPTQFQMFNVPVGALAALGGQNIQQLINQLIANGGINQANSTAISSLLQQLQSQQNSIFSQPVVTFGNGLTLMALSLGTAGIQANVNDSRVKTIEHAYLRASQNNEAIFRIGTRYPIVNATFSPIFNNSAISQVLQNNTFQAPVPSVNYEDLGLNLKAKPVVNGNSDVTLSLNMQFRALLSSSLNGIPVISNREYTGMTTLKEGESSVIVGSVSKTDTRSMSGLPGLGSIPLLNKLATTNNKEEDEDELMVVVTPYVLNSNTADQTTEIWLKQ